MKAHSVLLVLAMGCASSLPRPRVLSELDTTRQSPAVQKAQASAPQAYARAEELRRRANAAQDAEDGASAQILGEHALAAYEHAVVLSRLATAGARVGEAEARAAKAARELAELDAQERRLRAETDDLELRTRVLRDTLPLPTNLPAAPEREGARMDAARALSLQARLLCASARLLEPERPELKVLSQELDKLGSELTGQSGKAPIDEAVRLRSRCLSELGQVRRPKDLAEPARGTGDALLSELSNASYLPQRDDRGIVVNLRRAFGAGTELTPAATQTVQALGRTASTYPEFPVLVVLHSASSRARELDRQRLDSVVAILRQAGATRIDGALGGDAAPVVEPRRPLANDRNERIEVVFVAPGGS